MKKKLISAALAMAMSLSLAACGEDAAAPAESAGQAEATDAAAKATGADAGAEATGADAAAEATGTDTTVAGDVGTATEGVLVMATNAEFPPYEYHEGDGIVGIDADIAAAVAEKLGCTLQIEDIAFDSIIPEVTSGKADMGLAGMTVTEDRKQSVNFSEPYASSRQVVIVSKDSTAAKLADLGTDARVAVQTGTTGDIYVSDEYANVERYNKGMEAVQALSQGKVDAVVIDQEPAKVFVSEVEGLKILDESYAEEEYAAAIRKDNTALLEHVNQALAELKADGTLDKIVAKYITAE